MTGSACSICLDVFYRPVTCIPCGHVFCQSCIGQWECGQIRGCPHCREPIRDVQRIIWDDADIYKDCSMNRPGLEELLQEKLVVVQQRMTEIKKCIYKDVHSYCRRLLKLSRIETLRQLPGKAKASWEGFGQDMQLLIVMVTLLVVSLVIQDARNDNGAIQSLLVPVLGLLADVVQCLVCFIVFLLWRPFLCVGRILLEIVFTFWDAGLALVATSVLILWDLVSIPVVIVRAVSVWAFFLIQFSAEVVMTMVRFLFVVAVCTVLVMLFRPDPQFKAHLHNGLNIIFNFYREVRRKMEAA